MGRIFHPSFNTISRASVFGAVILLGVIGWISWEIEQSPYITRAGVVRDQPVPFSHEHHVKGLGIDCRYCHTSVTESSFAGIPSTKTCMTCHSQIWTNAPLLEPVRASWQNDAPIHWARVNGLPQYVYFNHSIHIQKGVGCATCHGPVQNMPLMYQHASLQMSWCLECHKAPEKYLRPREEVFNMDYQPPADQLALGQELKKRYDIRPFQAMIDCYTCHR
jgi:hypothetical protein